MGLSRALVDRWRRLRLSTPRVDKVKHFAHVLDIPEDLDRHTLALAGPSDRPKWAALECPCGHRHRLLVSLQHGHRPHWRLVIGDQGPGLYPSIDSIAERRCHFWLRDGRVDWAKDRL